ncbi:hypothetical protein BRC2024_KCUCJSVR_CDS_0188 [Acinetobacter phage vB_AbaM_KissB]
MEADKLKRRLNRVVDSLNSIIDEVREEYPDAFIYFTDGSFCVCSTRENVTRDDELFSSKYIRDMDSGGF